jgi:hypothetical protein
MNWVVMVLVSIFLPIVQPVVQNGVQKVAARVQQQAQPQPYIVYHNGEWWKLENNQWYVWRQQ